MPDFPLSPSLFIALSIFVGLLLSLIFTHEYNIKITDYILKILWIGLASIGIELLIGIYYSDLEHVGPLISAMAILLSAAVASASVMKNIAETKKNEADKHAKEASKFHLDKCTEGLEHFYELLQDGNNNRAKWIAAARALLTTLDLSNGIKEPYHMDFFELEKSKYRQKLYELYTNKEITPLFFTGIKDWDKSDITVSEIKESARNGDGYGYTYDDITNFIEVNSIVAVFSFLDYPDDYIDHDPLSNHPDRYKKALDLSWTFFEPKKSAHEFIKSTSEFNQYKDPL